MKFYRILDIDLANFIETSFVPCFILSKTEELIPVFIGPPNQILSSNKSKKSKIGNIVGVYIREPQLSEIDFKSNLILIHDPIPFSNEEYTNNFKEVIQNIKDDADVNGSEPGLISIHTNPRELLDKISFRESYPNSPFNSNKIFH